MVARRRRRYTTAAAAAAAAAAAVYPGVVKLQLSPAMARLRHIVVPLGVESGANREEKTYIPKRCTDHPIPRFHHHRRPRRRRRRRHHHHLRHPCHCISLGSPPLELSAPSPPSRAAHLDSRHVAGRRGDALPYGNASSDASPRCCRLATTSPSRIATFQGIKSQFLPCLSVHWHTSSGSIAL